MISISIPKFADLNLHYALIDFNGTLAVDGRLIDGIEEQLNKLAEHLDIHIITGDGMGTAKQELANVRCILTITPAEDQGITKQNYLHQLNPNATVAIGNGRNDQFILKESALGIAILGDEGLATEAILAADLVVPSIDIALALLNNPKRLKASLRF
ncbi:HAD family hydrolase [Legionella sp. km772]|uniref:HAD family hydrolase n=1 Tax=Legionella sp. km772 TaxID=2498111 RepID=UPI000F8CF2C7|nr:HAD family hydrolase [Legionella sp. km772]RUR10670.1 ATPase P [Legionella sp. km772]